MNEQKDLGIAFSVDQTPEEVCSAINNPGQWWGGISGSATNLGDQFVHQYKDVHYCKIKITECIPGQKVVWHVLESNLSSMKNPAEWTGTDIVFEITPKDGKTEVRFTHKGLTPQLECYESCLGAWTGLVAGNLKDLIATNQKREG